MKNDESRYCEALGLVTIDRPTTSCKYRTAFCRAHCYNLKLYRAFGHTMRPKDARLARLWKHGLDGAYVRRIMATKAHRPNRIRFCSRGEPLATAADIDRFAEIAASCPSYLFWIPTRAWRSPTMRAEIERRLLGLANLRIMASTDPTTSDAELESLRSNGWSTMFFGDDDRDYGYHCPKTWDRKHGACATCTAGCFSRQRVDVHLKTH
uniref:Gene product 88 domain-containing protein n=1 Tax=viral metagenome TaxID=1070528 RepID=A0A6M3L8B8_9ZZZZ